jgi:hypothetical protein
MQKTRQPKKHPARQITMRSTRWAHAADAVHVVEDQQHLQVDAALKGLLTVHPDWPFDSPSHASSTKDRELTELSLMVVRPRREKASTKRPQSTRSEVVESTISDVELDAQIALLSSSDRAKLGRFAAQELRCVPHFEADEGSAAWGRACRRVMRKLRACGQTLDDIEDGA